MNSRRHHPTLVRFALVLAAAVASAAGSGIEAQQPRVITDAQAGEYVDQVVTVEGVVVEVGHSTRSNTTFLNFGARYPNQTFAVVILESEYELLVPNPLWWEGRRVRVTGRVRMNQGRPEIYLYNAGQLRNVP